MFSPLWSVYHPNVSSRRHMRHFWSLFHQFLGLSEHIFTQTNVREDCGGDCQKAEQGHLTPRSLFFSHTRTSIQKNRVCIFPGEWAQLTQMESRCRRSFTARTEEPCEEASGLSVLRTWGHAGLVKLFVLGTIHLASSEKTDFLWTDLYIKKVKIIHFEVTI